MGVRQLDGALGIVLGIVISLLLVLCVVIGTAVLLAVSRGTLSTLFNLLRGSVHAKRQRRGS